MEDRDAGSGQAGNIAQEKCVSPFRVEGRVLILLQQPHIHSKK